jgi:hypothetical protein
MSTMRESLDRAMRASDDHEMWRLLGEDGVAVADQDTMSRAIHDAAGSARITSIPTRRTRTRHGR